MRLPSFSWSRAFSVSLGIHLILLGAMGYVTASLLTSPPEEPPVLLELLAESDTLATTPTDPSIPAASPQMATLIPPSPVTPAASVAEPSISASEPTMTAADVPADLPGGAAAAPAAAGSSAAGNPSVSAGAQKKPHEILPPRILERVDPDYPMAARQAGLEGRVLLRIEISASGRPGSVSVAGSSGSSALDNAAEAAARQWRFVPARDRYSGQSVSCTTTLPIYFRLH